MISVKKMTTFHLLVFSLLVTSLEIKTKTIHEDKKITIKYVDEDILDIINNLSDKDNKDVNVIVPTGANALNIKVNFSLTYKVTIDKAWELLFTFLDMAGYSLLPKNNMWIIVKNSKDVFDAKHSRQPTRLFIDTPPTALPATDERITYLYYLSNLKITDTNDNRIGTIISDLLPEQTFYKIDSTTNSILITAKSFDVKTFMELIVQLDQTEYKEKLEIIPLRYAQATQIAQVFNNQILKGGAPASSLARYRTDTKKSTEGAYFPESIKIIAFEPRNSLIVLGRSQAIDRVRDFVYKYIDVELESGKSILHIYKLQYLDAESFAPILQRIVDSSRTGGTGQSAGAQQKGATERFFDEVIIEADKPIVPTTAAGAQYSGGNKLIIAARNDDWVRIRDLIEQLDRPQPQVIIEVLIADLSLNDTKQIANQIRNPAGIPFPESVTAQAAHLTPVVIDQVPIGETTLNKAGGTSLATDLIEQRIDNFQQGSNANITPSQFKDLVAANIGSTILQVADDDGKTWDILKILKQFSYAKILSHPHVVVSNNHKANIINGETRLVDDQANPSTAGTVVKKKPIKAELKIDITPRISSEQEVILQIAIDIDEFSTENFDNADRNTRKLVTNAYLQSGSILALGGLVKTNLNDSATNTPLLAKIPFFGSLFRSRADREDQTSLAVFIMPTIIHPKLRNGIDRYTQTYANLAKDYAHEENLFHGLQDPITRWFFHRDLEAAEEVDKFITQQESKDDMPESVDSELFARPLIKMPESDPRAEQLKQLIASNDKQESRIQELTNILQTAVTVPNEATKTINSEDTQESVSNTLIASRSETLKALLNEEENPLNETISNNKT